ncbi:RDD family protein [Streptomyces luomodiensis]|uniref:RDD family protein n=1 Tax=Streptomyces luomodiensis TaxID=3026192 RepID=A0ABY9V8F6_9ACTN|nr:RDD family protein [Streptomyces sp. SCA4-21]WNF01195.1 RDD family protein [Streptomyces sp. SCA4-21]
MELQQQIADSPYGYPDWRSVPYVGERRGAGPDEDALGRFGARLAARVLDIGVLMAAVFLANVLTDYAGGGFTVLFIVVVAGYEPVLTTVYGATLGKWLCGLRVVRRDDGGGLGFGRALWRWACVLIGCAIPVLGIVNLLRCAWDRPYRQCLHDKAADTVVCRVQR